MQKFARIAKISTKITGATFYGLHINCISECVWRCKERPVLSHRIAKSPRFEKTTQ